MATSGRVVVLNGASSSGKSTLVEAFCSRRAAAGELWLRTGIDDYIMKIPVEFVEADGWRGPYGADGWRLVETDAGVSLEAGSAAQRVFAAYHRTVATWARQGIDVIVDEVVFARWVALDWIDALAGVPTLWVAVCCSPEVLTEREAARGDRVPGLATSLARVVHEHLVHDVEIDTTDAPLQACLADMESAINAFTPFQRIDDHSQ